MTENNADMLACQKKIFDLFSIYGNLISDQQYQFIDLYINENMQITQISKKLGRCKQQVHDVMVDGIRNLKMFENKLKLLKLKESKDKRENYIKTLNNIVNDLEKELNEKNIENIKACIFALKKTIKENH